MPIPHRDSSEGVLRTRSHWQPYSKTRSNDFALRAQRRALSLDHDQIHKIARRGRRLGMGGNNIKRDAGHGLSLIKTTQGRGARPANEPIIPTLIRFVIAPWACTRIAVLSILKCSLSCKGLLKVARIAAHKPLSFQARKRS